MERGPFWRAGLLPESPWEAHPVTIIANLGEPIGESRLRYFHSGLAKNKPIAHLFIHGDVNLRNYRTTERRIRRRDDREHEIVDMPHIWLSRPGIFGSSGHYRSSRRSKREATLVNGALDALKQKYGIGRFHLSGQSSGGRLIGILLSMRQDIGCAVTASGGLAQKRLHQMKGWNWRSSFPDPIDLVEQISRSETRRIFVMGDSFDSVVPFEIQEIYHRALSAAGIRSVLIDARGKARGPKSHQLAFLGLRVINWCAGGVDDAEISDRVARF